MSGRQLFAISLAVLTAAACGDGTTGPDGGSQVAVQMRTATPDQSASAPSATSGVPQGVTVTTTDGSLVLEGTNGTLTLDDIRLIVSELELEAEEGACEAEDDDECPEFEASPFFLDLPLDGTPISVVTDAVPVGIYDKLEFEAEDVDLDEDDEDENDITALREEVREAFPDWPNEVSMVVQGTFAEDGGDPQPFKVFFEAEVEVEMTVDPPLEITTDGASRALTIDVRPDMWFANTDGSVVDLTAFDWESTGNVMEFEAEFENGFTEIELD